MGLCETEGKTIICATHDMTLVQIFATRAVLLNHGVVAADSDVNRLLGNQQLLLEAGMA
jgi:energy-coupling factor transporter ATP-binding protein EcfA2